MLRRVGDQSGKFFGVPRQGFAGHRREKAKLHHFVQVDGFYAALVFGHFDVVRVGGCKARRVACVVGMAGVARHAIAAQARVFEERFAKGEQFIHRTLVGRAACGAREFIFRNHTHGAG